MFGFLKDNWNTSYANVLSEDYLFDYFIHFNHLFTFFIDKGVAIL